MSYNFHIGQDVVALENHPDNAFKKDDIFQVKAMQLSKCKCNDLEIHVGISNNSQHYQCTKCGIYDIENNSGCWWFSSTRFAPLDELTDISELQEVLEQPLFQVK